MGVDSAPYRVMHTARRANTETIPNAHRQPRLPAAAYAAPANTQLQQACVTTPPPGSRPATTRRNRVLRHSPRRYPTNQKPHASAPSTLPLPHLAVGLPREAAPRHRQPAVGLLRAAGQVAQQVVGAGAGGAAGVGAAAPQRLPQRAHGLGALDVVAEHELVAEDLRGRD